MSRTSCISHPEKEPLIIIHKWQLEFTEGNECAAALISFFTYWHDIKFANKEKAKHANDVAEMHGDPRTQDESLMQWHTEKDIEDGILIFKRRTIADALANLQTSGVIEIIKNPNPRYAFDRTRYFIFHPEILIDWLEKRKVDSRSRKNAESSRKNAGQSSENAGQSRKNGALSRKFADSSFIAEITPKITNKSTTEREARSHSLVAPAYIRICTNFHTEEKPDYFQRIKITRDEMDRLYSDYAPDGDKNEIWAALEDLESNIEAEPDNQKWKRSHYAILRKYLNTARRKSDAAY